MDNTTIPSLGSLGLTVSQCEHLIAEKKSDTINIDKVQRLGDLISETYVSQWGDNPSRYTVEQNEEARRYYMLLQRLSHIHFGLMCDQTRWLEVSADEKWGNYTTEYWFET